MTVITDWTPEKAARMTRANLAFQQTMQQAMQLLLQNTIAESAIKEHLGNTILRDQIGQRLLAPMLEQLSI